MSKDIGVIVDGYGEFHSLKSRFNDRCMVLKTDGPRGHNAKPYDIIRGSKKQIYILEKFNCKRVIIMLDFEQRSDSYVEFIDSLTNELTTIKNDFQVELFVAVPNIMVENWFLADIEHLSRCLVYLKDRVKQKSYEGTHGKKIIKTLFKRGHDYKEINHGKQMFLHIRLDVARVNSNSLDYFLGLMFM